MPIPYAERRRRRQVLLDALPPNLQGRIALRNVEAVSKLNSQAQIVLGEALDAGIKISAALSSLQAHPNAHLAELLQINDKITSKSHDKPSLTIAPRDEDLEDLTHLIQFCYPDMPNVTSEAMAGSQLMLGVLRIIQAQRECFSSQFGKTDFVIVVLCGLVQKNIEHLNQVVTSKRIYQEALAQSGVNWPKVHHYSGNFNLSKPLSKENNAQTPH